jgi:hypothetical protein
MNDGGGHVCICVLVVGRVVRVRDSLSLSLQRSITMGVVSGVNGGGRWRGGAARGSSSDVS